MLVTGLPNVRRVSRVLSDASILLLHQRDEFRDNPLERGARVYLEVGDVTTTTSFHSPPPTSRKHRRADGRSRRQRVSQRGRKV